MRDLEGKTALVTGAGSGIGREVALRYARDGARVALVDIHPEAVRVVQREIGAEELSLALACDVSDERQVEAAVQKVNEHFGRLDILVNAAGISIGKARTGETAPATWHRSIGVNLTGSFLMTRFVIPHMLETGSGCIVNIGSIYGLSGLPNDVAYAASKGGVIQLTRTAALEYARRNIRVNCICPGFVDTPLLGNQVGAGAAQAVGAVAVPMGRLGTPAEIAEMAAFLASDRASFITGAIISVDGGMSAR